MRLPTHESTSRFDYSFTGRRVWTPAVPLFLSCCVRVWNVRSCFCVCSVFVVCMCVLKMCSWNLFLSYIYMYFFFFQKCYTTLKNKRLTPCNFIGIVGLTSQKQIRIDQQQFYTLVLFLINCFVLMALWILGLRNVSDTNVHIDLRMAFYHMIMLFQLI